MTETQINNYIYSVYLSNKLLSIEIKRNATDFSEIKSISLLIKGVGILQIDRKKSKGFIYCLPSAEKQNFSMVVDSETDFLRLALTLPYDNSYPKINLLGTDETLYENYVLGYAINKKNR